MLRGDKAGLRARQAADTPVLRADLYDDVETFSRTNSRAWGPISPDLEGSPFAVKPASHSLAVFSIVDLKSEDVAGGATLWGIDPHNRSAHIGLSLRPSFRGRGLGTDVVRILVRYGFTTLGLHRLGLETLSDNQAMIHAATNAGFALEGTLREAAWVNGTLLDEVVFGLLAGEYPRHAPPPG